ncbi:MAG: N-acetylmuramic acid 6-phosphate etherase [Rhodothermia bacterium]|nr:MAG: N-acetylmuramic acid 6-phosphate etherase [Rhodothermia bacterium]
MNQESELFSEIRRLATEQRNPVSAEIDTASVGEILRIINSEDHRVSKAVAEEIPYIEEAVGIIVNSFRNGGRLFYAGAGTSGRLGILDASECPPTFGADPERVQGLIAGGREAVFQSQEGAEDLEETGELAIKDAGVTENDVVCGIAASRRTPYVVGAVKYARSLGCKTLFVTCTPRSEFPLEVDVAICPVPGPEVIMGSTRMKSGTAQKLVLNMLTTASFIRMGKVYENMMVDLQMTNNKLVERSKRTVMTVTGVTYAEAGELLDAAGGHVKTAIVMNLASVDSEEAQRRLERAGGFVRPAIDGKSFSPS